MTAITHSLKTSEDETPDNMNNSGYFKTIIENSQDVIGVLGSAGIFLYVNPAARQKLGYSPDELNGKFLSDFIAPEDRQRVLSAFHELTQTPGSSLQIQFRFLHKAGQWLFVECTWKNLLQDPHVCGIMINMLNVSERKKAEDALKHNEARYRIVAETAADAIVTLDQNSTVLFANKSTEKIFGYRIEELVGNNLGMLMPEHLRVLHNQGMKHYINTGEKHIPWESVEVIGLHKDGHEIPLEISFGKFIDNGQHIFTGIIRDITERKKTESELALKDDAINMASESIMITDARLPGNPLIYVNHGFEQNTGYTKEEVLGRSGAFLEGPDTDPEAAAEIFKIIDEHRSGKVEILNYKKDGTPFWNLLSLTPLSNSQGVVTNYIAVQTDISSRKHSEEQMQNALEKEKELNEMKSHFITTASHEFRTPLSAIISSSEILEYYNEKLTEDKRLLHLKKIQKAARTITDILEEILAYNKAEAGKFDFNPEQIDITSFCQKIIEDIPQHNDCKISFKNISGTRIAFLDKDLLRPTLENILANACKFSQPGSNIDCTVSRNGDSFIFIIEDHGIGIPDSDIERITEPFHRGINAGNIPGAGLGLAVVKRMVDIQKGTFEISSSIGHGTKITVTLPEGKKKTERI